MSRQPSARITLPRHPRLRGESALMPSRFLDEDAVARYHDYDFRFDTDTLRDRTIVLAGGTGGLGAAAAVLLACEGSRLVLGYRSNRKRAQELSRVLEKRGAAGVEL